ncbi:uncharacterized protein LOC132758570 [Ruditapes philippinarum]|uniref:uncharacterized protein LOC132758570 n=1 Tax=Ruditapes philippinarum TaxID=129788 RepID=UPI00295B2DEA|nr:uncharacterized protein LOC132758570 [Ruditapes philippinarum]
MANEVRKTKSGHTNHWHQTKAKAVALGFFCRHVSDKSKQREVLTSFMEKMKNRMKNDKDELSRKLQEYTINECPSLHTIRPKSPPQSTRKIPYPDVPTYVKGAGKKKVGFKIFPPKLKI